MSRTLKFRIFDDKLKTFQYFDLTSAYGAIPTDLKDNITEYTGINDSIGNEVYTGDIIKYDNHHDPVIIRWTEEWHDYHPGIIMANLLGQGGKFKIIGNIFENKDLT
jgi:hypothetical protein